MASRLRRPVARAIDYARAMAAATDLALVDAKLDQLTGAPAVGKLRALIRDGDDRDLFRINPYSFAEREAVSPDQAVELLLRAAAIGLVRVEWSLFCRGCGEYSVSLAGLCDLGGSFHCGACARDRATHLDEQVEVGFTIDPAIRPLRYARPETLELDDYFFTYRFSSNIFVRGEGARLVDYLRARVQLMTRLAPGERAEALVELDEGWVVGSPRAMITVQGPRAGGVRDVELEFNGAAFAPRPTIAPGRVRIAVHNASAATTPVLLYFTPIVTYFDYAPMLTGQRLLNTDDFRRYLHTEVVRPGTGIPTRDNTLLFTDLSGSTAIYDRIGDPAAFELVSSHFEALARVVTRWAGVVVKTIGDAVMASFSRPADAVRAALEMRDAVAGLSEPLRLKIGIHRGPALVVNVRDSIDYFGQTVNIAARVQSIAGAGEVCMTAAVHDDPEVRAQLARFGDVPCEDRTLRGVGDPHRVYRLAG
jgi:class 3 adenylate cyclase